MHPFIAEFGMEATPQPLGYTVAQAVKATGIGRTTIYADLKSGRLAARKRGKRTIILADDLRAYLASLPLKNDALREAAR